MRTANSIRASKTIQRRKAAGECVKCGDPNTVDKWFCAKHKVINAIYSRNRYRMAHNIHLDKPGCVYA